MLWLNYICTRPMYYSQTQLITSKGYPCEEYDVHTEDGYILGIQRIPAGKTHHEKRKYRWTYEPSENSDEPGRVRIQRGEAGGPDPAEKS